ncbi:hypothetical protein [Sebaldella termitidis]|uniref:hypothetical protein n=1 Tax=Sebaldella termitidis TaxID=826 RepID=UPI003EB928E0
MTKPALEKENKELKEKIKKLEKDKDVYSEGIGLIEKGELMDELMRDEEFRKNILELLKKKLKKYDFLSPAIDRAINEMMDDIDLLVFGTDKIKSLLIGSITDNISVIHEYMEWWDMIEAGNGYPEGMQTLYFEGKFDEKER